MQSKRILRINLRFDSSSERLHVKIPNPNCYISKSHQSPNEMLNWHDKFAEYGIKEAFIRDLFEYYRIKKLFHSSQENSVTLFVKVKKVFIALQHTSFPF